MLIAAMGATVGCTDELQTRAEETGLDEGELSEVMLNLSVNPFTINTQAGTKASEPSDTPETATAQENAIHDIWVFQYNNAGNLLIRPRYYTITDQAILSNLSVQLRTDVGGASVIYVVANTGNSEWANNGTDGSWQDFSTLAKLRAETLPEPFPIGLGKDEVSIPMGGSATAEVKAGENIAVPVTRMYAKLKIKVNIGVQDMELNSINIREIPWFCQIVSLVGETDASGEPEAVDFPEGTTFVSRAFAASDQEKETDEDGWTVIYVPETIRGETNAGDKNMVQPDNALAIDVTTHYEGGDPVYTVYPGGNETDNFNIMRNCVYRVTVNINTTENRPHQSSANCFIVEPDGFLAFEPYYRTETGGGYDFSDYLNPEVEELRIDTLEILWQTKDCIGDNSKGDLVYLEEGAPGLHQKIYVKTNAEGNALIAARNKNKEIIWSWHIWVTDHEPDNLGKAIVYTTYDWDENGIYPDRRIPGYAIMSCNLGALADTPEDWNDTQTFGMLYQWGRKDPFPPLRSTRSVSNSDHILYDDRNTDVHFGNDNSTEVHKTSEEDNTYLFHSVVGNKLPEKAVEYSIAHPTVFICGTNDVYGDTDHPREPYLGEIINYFNRGDWCPENESDDKLWGGLEPSTSGMTSLNVSNGVHLFDNYGDEKSIFDPCPKGWRVAPGELWLEFSNTGYNPTDMSHINYDSSPNSSNDRGMTMYMQAWRSGPTSYFPAQGTRVGDGGAFRMWRCGNYHNATADLNNRVNILHIHFNDPNLFNIFEDTYTYTVKSVAGPIRCVRDSK